MGVNSVENLGDLSRSRDHICKMEFHSLVAVNVSVEIFFFSHLSSLCGMR